MHLCIGVEPFSLFFNTLFLIDVLYPFVFQLIKKVNDVKHTAHHPIVLIVLLLTTEQLTLFHHQLAQARIPKLRNHIHIPKMNHFHMRSAKMI